MPSTIGFFGAGIQYYQSVAVGVKILSPGFHFGRIFHNKIPSAGQIGPRGH